MNQAHQYNLDAAQREIDRRNAEGEDVSGLSVNPQTYAIEGCGSFDLTPTWGEWGNIYRRLAESREVKALKHLSSDLARAMAAAQALKALGATLTDEQSAIVAKTMTVELTKQGF